MYFIICIGSHEGGGGVIWQTDNNHGNRWMQNRASSRVQNRVEVFGLHNTQYTLTMVLQEIYESDLPNKIYHV